MAKVEVAYVDWLKALQVDSNLFQSLKDFVHDLKAFKNDKTNVLAFASCKSQPLSSTCRQPISLPNKCKHFSCLSVVMD